ncbi:hypothetical protein NY547_08890 [Cnuibacter physcomitrellae]|uniref:hypothetical protein n=1 Tax=Cnuibacter physcomitrellae TaxID=1619308 RepID=UPI002175D489|nr:hypothetical protein [Cnuibacter physcomitrellae]MCS5497350.1 hypothetical protein [Cnuibacter physcomitrellae]
MSQQSFSRARHRVGAVLSAVALTAALAIGTPLAASAEDLGLPSTGTVERVPAAPVIGGIAIGKSTASIEVRAGAASDSEDGGPVDTFEAAITRDSTGETTTQQRGTPGSFDFTDLAPGLYRVVVTAYGPGGDAAVTGYGFVIPDTVSAPLIDAVDAGWSGVTLSVRNVNDAIPAQPGPTERASISYRLILDDGVDVYETASSAIDGTIGYAHGLKPDTTYTATLTVSYFSPSAGWFGTSEPAITTFTTRTGTDPVPTAPRAPLPENLTEELRGGIGVPPSAVAGGTVTVNVGELAAPGEPVNGWLFSTPTLLGTEVVDAAGNVTFVLPADIPAGAHRLAVTDSEDNLLGWNDIQVAAAASGASPAGPAGEEKPSTTLAETGAEVPVALAGAALLLLLAGGVIRGARGRARRV